MSRPEHLGCVNTAEGIRRINEEQAYYDQDPEQYERQQQEAQEQYRIEQQKEAERHYEEEQQRNELPF